MVWWMSLREKDGFEVVKKKNTIPIMRQVLIAAGWLVLLWISLRWLVNPYLLGISIFVGAGLVFAGISWFCWMTKVLALMPRNQTDTNKKKTTFSSDDNTIQIHQFEDTDLAIYSYALVSQWAMVIIDPTRDPQPYYDYADTHQAKIIGVIETHPHADFASSHLEIAQTTQAKIFVSTLVWAEYPHTWFDDGDEIKVGSATLQAINTPGHSPDSISILALDSSGKQLAVFTGDTLFVGDVWRADLRESVGNIQQQQEDLAKSMYTSTREKLMTLQHHTLVLPAHGSGTLCGKWLSDDNRSTIEKELMTNPALQTISQEEFVSYLTSEQPHIPLYFPISVEHNKTGNRSIEEAKKMIAIVGIESLETNKGIIDTRPSLDYLKYKYPWSINIPLGNQFSTTLWSLFSLDQKLLFIVENMRTYQSLVKYLLKIGYEEACWGIIVLQHEALSPHTLWDTITAQDHRIIDVRSPATAAKNPIFEDQSTIRIPLYELNNRVDELPNNKILVPFCWWSYQSDIALSIIKKERPELTVHKFGDALWEMMPLA
jgi:glyoxylase-like metal-dependent hydrolase (beta-lactamase superfamily II)/rhodanese-related sulfurtransferase